MQGDRASGPLPSGELRSGELRAAAGEGAVRLVVARGPRAAEARLLAEVGDALARRSAAMRDDPRAALARPLRIVVPSRSLREHLCATLVRPAGSLLGIAVQTHFALALELLERAEAALPRGAALVPVLVRRHAAREPVLAHWLGGLEDGFGIVEAGVRDLLDAGFAAPHAGAVEEAIAAAAAGAELGVAPAERASAVVRVAERVLADLEAHGLGHGSALLGVAREALERAGPEASVLLPTAGLWIHGFADATGLVTDWLEALVRAFDGCVVMDVPLDPAEPGRVVDAYSSSFRRRMETATGGPPRVAEADGAASPPGEIALVCAPGTPAEVRVVADRVRALLDGGVAAESIGILARRLEPYRAALDAQLGRLAIPFSTTGVAAGPDATTRRAAALTRLLERGEAATIDTWMDADARAAAADPDLRVAFHVLGIGRLGQVDALPLDERLGDESHLRLPVRRGGRADEDVEPSEESTERAAPDARRREHNRRRSVGRDAIADAFARARRVVERLRAWPARAPASVQIEALRALVGTDLAWSPERPGCAAALGALDALASELPAGLELEREELALLVARALAEAASSSLGGAGAGVQVLTITAARGRCFEHLFVLGLNRDSFPRPVTDDPVLPDAVRRRLRRDVLPELPVRERLREEERHLFASICDAAPRVTLSWQHLSDEGRTRPESPFVVKLRMARPERAVEKVDVAAEVPGGAPRPAHEHALRAGLLGSGAARSPLRTLAVAEVRAQLEALGPVTAGLVPERLAELQLAALRELDGRPARPGEIPPSPGPWFGWVGPRPPGGDRDAPEFHATRLEDLARCPWQAFLRRELGLEPVPDALAALPAPDSRLRGMVVHGVLEAIVRAELGERARTLEEALALGGVRVPWPPEPALEQLLADASRAVARDEGILLPGFAAALARSVRPLLEAARAVDWREAAGPTVLGAELRGELVVSDRAGRPRRIGFRADRADLEPDGSFRITDYKTGKPISSRSGTASANPSTQLRHFLEGVGEGRWLQAPAYWLAARALAPGRAVEGRYLFLREDLEEAVRVFRVDEDGADVARAFEETVRVLFDAVDNGAMVPRLETPEDQGPCAWCEVAAACLRGEGGARARLRDWKAAAASQAAGLSPAERALLGVLRLGEDEPDAANEGEET